MWVLMSEYCFMEWGINILKHTHSHHCQRSRDHQECTKSVCINDSCQATCKTKPRMTTSRQCHLDVTTELAQLGKEKLAWRREKNLLTQKFGQWRNLDFPGNLPVMVQRQVIPNISSIARYRFHPNASRINNAPENRFTEILVKMYRSKDRTASQMRIRWPPYLRWIYSGNVHIWKKIKETT